MGYDKYCSASSMFVENRTDGFDSRVRKLLFKLVRFLRETADPLIDTVINSSARRSSNLLQTLWEEYLLYLPYTIIANALLLW